MHSKWTNHQGNQGQAIRPTIRLGLVAWQLQKQILRIEKLRKRVGLVLLAFFVASQHS